MLYILNICTESNPAVISYEKLLVVNNIFKVLLNIHLFFALISTLGKTSESKLWPSLFPTLMQYFGLSQL